jgi:hypothetical protein
MADPDNATAWCVIEGTAIFLDVPADRYFRLPKDQNDRLLRDNPSPPVCAPVQSAAFPLPSSWLPPARRCEGGDTGAFSLGDVARALWVQRRWERRLARRPFAAALQDLRSAAKVCAVAPDELTDIQLREVRAFEHAKLLRRAADRCLPRSIALAMCLARRGCRSHVVLGVKLAPFAAHCWVQAGDAVLNDELEEVLRYTPILVV